jgi:hypothetical protein
VNGEHFRAFFWLRWRLRVNQWKRGGLANVVLLAVLAVGAVMLALGLLVALFLVGLFALRQASPLVLLYVWDGVVIGFLFIWASGLVTELQRSEVLSLDKFLHLPVSVTGAFVVNYLSSLFSLTLLLFVPVMVGLSLGLVAARGPALLLLFPLLAAFLLMVTAVTYQFQGWLASLMANQRRRRTIIFLATAVFIVLSQLPNLFNLLGSSKGSDVQAEELANKRAELDRALSAREITLPEYQQRLKTLQRDREVQTAETRRERLQRVEQATWLTNLLLPPGWLPLGAMALAEGKILPALLATLGLALLGTASLWRSYQTTLRLYTGQFTSGRRRPAPARPATVEVTPASHLLEKQVPWLPEQVAAIALSSFRSLTRAPEARMMFLSSVLLVVIFGTLFGRGSANFPPAVRPLFGFGAMAFILMGMVQIVGNQFGFDRDGFRVFVLCGARRRDILLGKNLAIAPFALGMGLLAVVVLQVIMPMRFDYLLAVLPQFLSMYLLFCLLANALSLLAPVRVPPGALRATKMGIVPVLLHLAFFLVLFPLVLAPTLLPLGVQLLWEQLGWIAWAPVGLLLSLVECAAVVFLYRLVLSWQGQLLQAREQKILEMVRTKAE